MRNLKRKSILKKILLTGLMIVVIAFFAIPSFIFADEGDATTYVGVREQEANGGVYTGQYILGDSEDTLADSENNGDTEVFCIDGDHYVEQGDNKYEYTGLDASDDLANEIGQTDALAVEIISKTATGASPTEDQVAVWKLTGDSPAAVYNDLEAGQKLNVEAIAAAAKAIAIVNTDSDETNDIDIDKINSIEVTLDNVPLYNETTDQYSDHLATAIMAEPFVPGITDVGKLVYWYILAGSYNVSFSQTDLVTEAKSVISDKTDNSSDIDKDGKTTDDNFGEATMPYYFFWWGGDYPQYEEMKVGIGAWVDIDKDGKLDVVDPVGGTDTKDSIKSELEYVKVNQDGTVTIDKNGTTDYTDDSVLTDKLTDDKFDIHIVEGGKVIKAISDRSEDGAGAGVEVDIVDKQRFITDAFDEPYDKAFKTYSAWGNFTIFKTSSLDKTTPVKGATYSFIYYRGQDKYIGEDYPLPETGTDGKASLEGLPWGTYILKETDSPPGFLIDPDEHYVYIGGKAFDGELKEAVINAIENVSDAPEIPPDTPEDPATPDTPVITVAGLTETGGIQVLAFTGPDPIIPIAGLTALMAGLAMVAVTLSKRMTLKWKHVKR